MSKKQNEIKWEAALKGSKDMATNRGFRMRDGRMVTYEQQKLGLSAYYDKRWVLEDGLHTEPIEFHFKFTSAGGREVFGGITSSSSRTKPRLGPSRK